MRTSKLMADLRRERQQRELAMTPAERLKLAGELAERSLRIYMSANRVDRETALRAVRRSRRIGRRPSRCFDDGD
jgi:hypothetical protein